MHNVCKVIKSLYVIVEVANTATVLAIIFLKIYIREYTVNSS